MTKHPMTKEAPSPNSKTRKAFRGAIFVAESRARPGVLLRTRLAGKPFAASHGAEAGKVASARSTTFPFKFLTSIVTTGAEPDQSTDRTPKFSS